jgi:hypothetical protein
LVSFKKGNLPEDCHSLFTSTPWLEEFDFREKHLEKADFERKIKLEVLDVAGIYHYKDKPFNEFFDKLCSQENLKYFENRSF